VLILETVSLVWLPPPSSSNYKLFADLDPPSPPGSHVYDLVANIVHESVAGTTRDKEATVWKVHVRAGSGGGNNERWFQIQDLIVEEMREEMIFLGETVLQIWERRVAPPNNSVTLGSERQ